MKVIFWNSAEKRPRSLIRIITFILIALLLTLPISLISESLSEFVEKSFINLFMAIPILASIYICGRFIDKREWSEFGITIYPVRQFMYGALSGALLISMMFGITYALGWIELSRLNFNKLSAYPFILVFGGQIFRYLAGSTFEEAFTRGYLLKNIAEGLRGRFTISQSVFIAYIITSSLFGFLHLANDNATILSSVNLTLFGLVVGWTVLKTGKLHFAIGFHAFWNIFQNNVFGAENSGKQSIVSILSFENVGNDLWTGGAFGIEGGLVCSLVLLLTLIIMMRDQLFRGKEWPNNVLL